MRADRPGLGLEESIDAHWIDWFGGAEFQDAELFAGVNFYIETHPARTWPTVAEVEVSIKAVLRIDTERGELEEGPCFWDCVEGLVYQTITVPIEHTALVPCQCHRGRSKLEALKAWDEKRKKPTRGDGRRP